MSKKLTYSLFFLSLMALVAALVLSSNVNVAHAGFSMANAQSERGTGGNGFSYQGKLYLNGQPAFGDFEMTFTLHDRDTSTDTIASITKMVTVRNGLFHTYLDFEDATLCFHHVNLFLQVKVENTVITPRHFLSRGPQDVKYETTIIVSPVYNGNNQLNPLASGSRLLKAVACTRDGDHTASSNRPILIKVEPGVYNLGGRGLHLQPFTDLEGSGEKITYITSNIPSPDPRIADTDAAAAAIRATVHGAPFTEVRDLTIANENDGDTDQTYTLAMYNYNIAPDQMRINDVTLIGRASDAVPTRFNGGIFNHRASPRLDDVTIHMFGGSFTVGLANYWESAPYSTHLEIRSSGAHNTNFGILNVHAGLALHDSVVVANGRSSDRNVAIENVNSNVYAQDIWALASGGFNDNIALSYLSNENARPTAGYVVDARLIARHAEIDIQDPISDHEPVLPPTDAAVVPVPSGASAGFYTNSTNPIEFNHVEIAGDSVSVVTLDTQLTPSVFIGASKLTTNDDGFSVRGNAVKCVNVHDQHFDTDYGNECPNIVVPVE